MQLDEPMQSMNRGRRCTAVGSVEGSCCSDTDAPRETIPAPAARGRRRGRQDRAPGIRAVKSLDDPLAQWRENAISSKRMATNSAEIAGGDPEGRGRVAAARRRRSQAVEDARGFCPGDERVGVDGRAHIASGERQRLPQVQRGVRSRTPFAAQRSPPAGARSQPASVSSPARVRAMESSSKSDRGRTDRGRWRRDDPSRKRSPFSPPPAQDPRCAQGRGRRTRSRAPLARARTMGVVFHDQRDERDERHEQQVACDAAPHEDGGEQLRRSR